MRHGDLAHRALGSWYAKLKVEHHRDEDKIAEDEFEMTDTSGYENGFLSSDLVSGYSRFGLVKIWKHSG